MVSVAQELHNAGFFVGTVISRLRVKLQEKLDALPKGSLEDLGADIRKAIIESFMNGEIDVKREVVLNMLKYGISLNLIADTTKISLKRIKVIKKQIDVLPALLS